MRRSLQFAALALLCMPMFGTTSAQAQATRTWVSGVGDDVNPCSRTAPCKTFAGAISKTAAGGEINCLDPAGYGAVTITKSMTIDCQGTNGSILASGTNGVNVNDSATGTPGTIVVNLKNLSINGAPGTGLVGINFISGASLQVDNVSVMNFNGGTAAGLRVGTTNAGAARLVNINDSHFWNNGTGTATGANILVFPTAGSASVSVTNTKIGGGSVGLFANGVTGLVSVTITGSSVANNRGHGASAINGANLTFDNSRSVGNGGTGVFALGTGITRINNSTITGNAIGVGGGGNLRSYKNNAINGNATDGTPITQETLN